MIKYFYKHWVELALVSLILFLINSSAMAQTTVSGTVTDANTSEVLPGVNVYVQGTTGGTSTDNDGFFELQVPSLQDTLTFSYIGYQTLQVPINGRSQLEIQLQNKVLLGDELVVVGYGTQERSDLSSSISSVDAEAISRNASLPTTAAALEGTTPGVSATVSSGAPGAGVNIRIRGANSFGNNDPLVIIDGVPGNLNNVNPQDIESMQVLKDAASAAIYGSRAANGVIIVTTKSGEAGRPVVTLNTSYGVQEAISQIPVANGEEYARIDNALHEATDGQVPPFDQLENPSALGNGTDWQDEMYTPAPILKTYMGVSGGNENTTYSISGSFDKQKGIAESTWYRKGTLHYKGQQDVGVFTFSQNLTYSDENQRNLPYGGDKPLTLQTILAQPIFPVSNENNIGGFGGAPDFLPAQAFNPIGLADLQENRVNNNSLNANVAMDVALLENLTYKLNVGYQVWNGYSREYVPEYFFSNQRLNRRATLSETRSRTNHWIVENTMNYAQDFGNHSLNLLVGVTAEEDHYSDTGAYMEGFPNNQLQVINAGTGYSTDVWGSDNKWAMYSLLSRVNYNYDSRYYLTANIRRDGSSRFGTSNRYGLFPSVSAAWRISNEQFFNPLNETITDLKLRGSYGELGNQPTSNYSYIPSIDYIPYLGYIFGEGGNFQSGAAIQNFANPAVQWESTRSLDIGTDLEIAGNVNLTFDYYLNKTDQLLMNVPIPPSLGASTPPLVNTGEVQNQGIELSLGYSSPAQNSDFNYNISGNLSTVRNKVLELGYEGQIIYGTSPHRAATGSVTAAQVGYPIGAFYLLQEDGLFQSQQEIDNYTNAEGGLIQPLAEPGDVKYIDTNGDGQISSNDAVFSGSPFPDFSFGLNFSGNYKNFDFTVFLQGEYGKKIFDANTWITNRGTVDYNFHTDLLDAWTPDNTDTSVPRLTFTDPNHNSYPSTRFLYDGTYLRLKTLQIGYTLPQELLSQFGVSQLRLYVNGSNLLTFTDYPGYDPSYTSNGLLDRGLDQGLYPVSQMVTGGIQLKF